MASKVEWLIAGLGNPGKKYANNRHNIGWMAASKLAERYKKPVMPLNPVYLQSAMRISGKLVLAIMPTTYMNKSGDAIRSALKYYDVPIERIIAVYDEYNFEPGRIHLRRGGGDGGHNGIASIMLTLGTENFMRLRCGIGKDFSEGGMADYVLSDFPENQIEMRDDMIVKAVDAIEATVRFGANKAMSLVNSGDLWKKERYR